MSPALSSAADVRDWIREETGAAEVEVRSLRNVASARTFLARARGERLFVKLGPRTVAERENLAGIRPPAAAESGISEVRFADAEKQALALRFEEGRSFLSELVRRGHAAGALLWGGRLRADARRIGRCLAALLAANGAGRRDVTAESVRAARAQWEGVRRFFRPEEKARVGAWLGTLRLPPVALYRCSHDVSARNILLGPARVTVVDWERVLERPAYYTLAYLSANIEARARLPGYRLNFMRRLSGELVAAFREAGVGEFDPGLYRVFRALYLIEYVHGYETKTGVFEPWEGDRPSMNRYIENIVRPDILEVP